MYTEVGRGTLGTHHHNMSRKTVLMLIRLYNIDPKFFQ